MRLGRDGIAGLICLAISLTLLPAAFGLPKLPIVPVGPGFYPSVVLIFMAAISAVLVLQDLLQSRRPREGAPAEQTGAQAERAYGLVAAAFITVAIYIGLLPLLGFRVATALFVLAFQIVLERPASLATFARQIAVGLGTAAVTFLVFEHYLSVLLPRGSWTGW